MEFFVGRRQAAVSGEGVGALIPERLLPQAEEVLPDPEPAGGLGDGELLIGDHPHGVELELGRVGLALTSHRWTPRIESTPLTPCPRNLGNLISPDDGAGGFAWNDEPAPGSPTNRWCSCVPTDRPTVAVRGVRD